MHFINYRIIENVYILFQFSLFIFWITGYKSILSCLWDSPHQVQVQRKRTHHFRLHLWTSWEACVGAAVLQTSSRDCLFKFPQPLRGRVWPVYLLRCRLRRTFSLVSHALALPTFIYSSPPTHSSSCRGEFSVMIPLVFDQFCILETQFLNCDMTFGKCV